MNKALLIALVVCGIALVAHAGVLIQSPSDEWAAGAEGTYIVIFDESATEAQKNSLMKVSATGRGRRAPKRYQIGSMSAFSGHLDEAQLEELAKLPFVSMITKNKKVTIMEPKEVEATAFGSVSQKSLNYLNNKGKNVNTFDDNTCQKQVHATWGLDRITEREIQLDGWFFYRPLWGQDVVVYVVDTGIFIEHDEFEGRAIWGASFADDRKNSDCNGHGTHVSGTIGGKTYGIARNATLVAVKVLNCEGSGSYDSVMSGIEFVVADAKKRGKPAVINMSLGGPKDAGLDKVIKAAVAAGVTVVVAGGNENTDACNSSPAGVAEAITVGATEVFTNDPNNEFELDGRSSFSNYGPCIDIFAPGSRIASAWIGKRDSLKTISGTSMASPHVAGVAAVLLSQDKTLTPAGVRSAMLNLTTDDHIDLKCGSSSQCKKSPNKLLYIEC